MKAIRWLYRAHARQALDREDDDTAGSRARRAPCRPSRLLYFITDVRRAHQMSIERALVIVILVILIVWLATRIL